MPRCGRRVLPNKAETTEEREMAINTIEIIEQLLSNGQYDKVLDVCESVQLDSELPRKFWYCKGRALEALGEKHLAIEAYRCEIASVDSVPPSILGHIGALFMDIGRWTDGVICLRESCDIEPSVERLVLLGAALSKCDRIEEARDAVQKALSMDPRYDEAWHNLGVYLMEDCPSEAEKAFRRALELDPGRADSCGELAGICGVQGRVNESLEWANEGLRIDPRSGLCHLVVGQEMEGLGKFEEAERAYVKAYKCDHYKVDALVGIARICERMARPNEALTWYGRGIRAWPDDPRVSAAFAAFTEGPDYKNPEIGD